jgi:hypothetical protein
MNIIHFFVDGVGSGGGESQRVPRVGETIIFAPDKAKAEYKVTNVVWLQQTEETGDGTAQVHLTRIQRQSR